MSSDGIGFIDPHERYFQDECGKPTSCAVWSILNDFEEIESMFIDQILPFCPNSSLDDLKQDDKGTVFRFPLRTDELHKNSELSHKVYTPDHVRKLFNDLERDADNLLLFLTHLEKIEVLERHNGTVTRLFDICISSGCRQMISLKRNEFLDGVRANEQAKSNTEEENSSKVSVTFPFVTEVTKYKQNQIEVYEHFVSLYYENINKRNGLELKAKQQLNVLPQVGIALSLESGNEKGSGRIFCFLPLPLDARSPTGFKVHVNGYFSLDQNRNHLKWPSAGDDMDKLQDLNLVWNLFLMKDLVPKSMVKMALWIAELGQVVDPNEYFQYFQNTSQFSITSLAKHLYNVMPMPENTTPEWKPCEIEFYKEIIKHSVFLCKEKSNKIWQNVMNTVVDNMDDDSELVNLIRSALSQDGKPFVSLPNYVIKGLEFHNNFLVLMEISADLVCECLKRQPGFIENLKVPEKLMLLEYLLCNLEKKSFSIKGLKLLPLGNGNWTTFELRNHSPAIYVPTAEIPQKLFPGLDRYFLKLTELNEPTTAHLSKITEQGKLFKIEIILAMTLF